MVSDLRVSRHSSQPRLKRCNAIWGWTKLIVHTLRWDRAVLWLSAGYMEVGLCQTRIPEQEENNIEIVIQDIQKYKLGLKRKTISSEPAACECTSSAISYTLSLCFDPRRWEPKVVNKQSVIFDTLLLAAEQKDVSNSTINNQPMQNGKNFSNPLISNASYRRKSQKVQLIETLFSTLALVSQKVFNW